MMLQLYTLCFPLIHWRHFFETTKIKLSRTNNNKNIKEHKKNANLAQLANQKNKQQRPSQALRLPASSYDDIPAALGFRSSPSSSSRSWSCCGYDYGDRYYALFTEWATFRFSIFSAQPNTGKHGQLKNQSAQSVHKSIPENPHKCAQRFEARPILTFSGPKSISNWKAKSTDSPHPRHLPPPLAIHLFRSLLNVFPPTKAHSEKPQSSVFI